MVVPFLWLWFALLLSVITIVIVPILVFSPTPGSSLLVVTLCLCVRGSSHVLCFVPLLRWLIESRGWVSTAAWNLHWRRVSFIALY